MKTVKYIHQEISLDDVLDASRYVDARSLLALLHFWSDCLAQGIRKNNLLDHTREYNQIGNSMAKICKNPDQTRLATLMLRQAICAGAKLTDYDKNFIQGVEQMLTEGKTFSRKQSWQLAMLLTDHLEF